RWSDIMNLRNSDVKADYIHLEQEKTGGEVLPTLNKYSRAIIKKYRKPGHGKLFDIKLKKKRTSKGDAILTQQFVNREIKSIAKDAGLTEEILVVSYYGPERREERKPKWTQIKTHTGRRSFSRILSQLGVS